MNFFDIQNKINNFYVVTLIIVCYVKGNFTEKIASQNVSESFYELSGMWFISE